MVCQSLNMSLRCETHPAPRQCVRHHTQVFWFWCTAYRYLRDSLSAETVCPSPYSSPLVLVYSLPLLAILNYGASVTEQTPLVRDSPSAETSGFGVQLTVTLNYGVSVTEHKPFGARLTKHRDLWFWCTAYRYPLSSTMVRQSLNISLLVRDSPSAETSDLVYSLPLPAILDYGVSVTEHEPLVGDSPSAETVCPSPYSSPLVLVYSLPLLAILNYGASVTEQSPLVRDSPSAETSGFGVQLTITLNYGVSVTEHKPFG